MANTADLKSAGSEGALRVQVPSPLLRPIINFKSDESQSTGEEMTKNDQSLYDVPFSLEVLCSPAGLPGFIIEAHPNKDRRRAAKGIPEWIYRSGDISKSARLELEVSERNGVNYLVIAVYSVQLAQYIFIYDGILPPSAGHVFDILRWNGFAHAIVVD